MDTKDMLRIRLENQRASLQQKLTHSLRTAKARIEDAMRALEKGEHLDDHLIVNMAHMATDIAQHNLVVDVMPYLESNGTSS